MRLHGPTSLFGGDAATPPPPPPSPPSAAAAAAAAARARRPLFARPPSAASSRAMRVPAAHTCCRSITGPTPPEGPPRRSAPNAGGWSLASRRRSSANPNPVFRTDLSARTAPSVGAMASGHARSSAGRSTRNTRSRVATWSSATTDAARRSAASSSSPPATAPVLSPSPSPSPEEASREEESSASLSPFDASSASASAASFFASFFWSRHRFRAQRVPFLRRFLSAFIRSASGSAAHSVSSPTTSAASNASHAARRPSSSSTHTTPPFSAIPSGS